LLAAAQLTAGAELWTRDKRLHAVAVRLGLARAPL
jgi:predicted nucleic acid-binding protein